MKFKLLIISAFIVCVSCNEGAYETADLVIQNTTVYTVDSINSSAKAVAVLDGKVLKVGSDEDVERHIGDSTIILDLKGKYVYPGFIDGHAHVFGVGDNILNVDLMGVKSYEEMIDKIAERAKATPPGTWIVGRGWHQDKWDQTPERMFNGFPTHHKLSEKVPNHPVWMKHASGHAGIANEKAMEIAGIDKASPDPAGGDIFKDITQNPTGIFNETAQKLISEVIPKSTSDGIARSLSLAIEECLKNGLTGFHTAGEGRKKIKVIEEFAKRDQLKIRLYTMLSGRDQALLQSFYERGPLDWSYDDHLSIRSIKLYSDGALGSRGAWLLKEYSDAKGFHGLNVMPIDSIRLITKEGLKNGFQMCTHAIGDRGNQEVLNIYEAALKDTFDLDHRFRIEHAQHLHPDDIPRFAKIGVIPAMQAIHMSSDRPWAIFRLGRKRIENGAYMWSQLIESGSVIVNGTDAPVEPLNPIPSFYASVTRKTLKGKPEGGYEPSQKMTRLEALKSYTIWAAYGGFLEDKVGSIEEGKWADFTILDQDIMTIEEDRILNTQVEMTVIGGEILFERGKS